MDGWRKSSYSGGNGGSCVEVADAASVVMVRDTTDRDGAMLALSADAWQAFTSKIKSALQERPHRERLRETQRERLREDPSGAGTYGLPAPFVCLPRNTPGRLTEPR
jgi:Domain of unknown function (DUF397)